MLGLPLAPPPLTRGMSMRSAACSLVTRARTL
jgi:hypothetical protein